MTEIKCLACGEPTDLLGHICDKKLEAPLLWDRGQRHRNSRVERQNTVKIQEKI